MSAGRQPPGPGRSARARFHGAPPSGATPERAPARAPRSDAPSQASDRDDLGGLVLLVATLSREPRALLDRLAGPVRPGALARLAEVQRLSRAERHAALARCFSVRTERCDPPLPGALGRAVEALSRSGTVPGGGPLTAWAQRVVRERGG